MSHTNISGTPSTLLGERHHVSGLNSQFNGGELAFADYVARQREIIFQVRAGTDADKLKKIIDGNAPFELQPAGNYLAGKVKPYKRGVLLTHGLTDSPYFMRHLAAFFQENGFRVMAVLLPGHGTRPGDLLNVRWQEWAKAVAYGADRLAAEADEIYLAGFSAGGALSVYQSLRDNRVRGLFLFSPAFKISPKAAWANLHRFYSWLIPSAKWVSILPDRDIYKYESFPKNAAAQMYALTQEINEQELLHKLNIPVFAAVSADDTTADTSATLNFMMRIPHPSSKLVLYTNDEGKHMHGFPEEKLELVNSAVSGQLILSSAHTAIVLPSDDAHYGAAGDYSNCTHYYPGEMEKYDACNNKPNEVLQGEITEQNLAAGTLRRLMYNPHFAALRISMRQFIEKLP
jgi:esterase/lipase